MSVEDVAATVMRAPRPMPGWAAGLAAWVAKKRAAGVPWSHIAKQCGRSEASLRAAFEEVTG